MRRFERATDIETTICETTNLRRMIFAVYHVEPAAGAHPIRRLGRRSLCFDSNRAIVILVALRRNQLAVDGGLIRSPPERAPARKRQILVAVFLGPVSTSGALPSDHAPSVASKPQVADAAAPVAPRNTPGAPRQFGFALHRDMVEGDRPLHDPLLSILTDRCRIPNSTAIRRGCSDGQTTIRAWGNEPAWTSPSGKCPG